MCLLESNQGCIGEGFFSAIFTDLLADEELNLATQLVRGHSRVEVPGKWNSHGDAAFDAIILPEPTTLVDFVTAPCKQDMSLMWQT